MFGSDVEQRPPVPLRPDFEIAETLFDAGRRVQGETIDGRIEFKASRSDIRTIRPVERVPGLAIGAPVWTDANAGYLSYRWETSLLSENIDKTISLEAIATSDVRAAVQVHFRARIEGKIGFKQMPELVDPLKDGQVELQIQNLTKTPLKILSVRSNNPSYIVDENVPESIEPGRTGRLLIRYHAQRDVAGATLALVLSENLNPTGITTVPLNVKLPEEKRATYTPETLKPLVGPPPAGFNQK
jgi:hypothetical protein